MLSLFPLGKDAERTRISQRWVRGEFNVAFQILLILHLQDFRFKLMESFIPFAKRGAKWADITPIQQYQGGPAPIAPIAYSDECKSLILILVIEIMGYFRAIFVTQEISERAFDLTGETIEINPGNYSAWHFRRKLIHALQKDLQLELFWLNQVGLKMEKNYQIWHHRRCIVEMHSRKVPSESLNPLLSQELLFLKSIFASDAKNYHAWSHLIWLVERFSLWHEDRFLDFADLMLEKDVRNNSVWSFRYFLLISRLNHSAKDQGKDPNVEWLKIAPKFIDDQVEFITNGLLQKDWRNEAVWAYLRGMVTSSEEEETNSLNKNARLCLITKCENLCKVLDRWEMEEEEEQLRHNRFLQACLFDLALARGQKEKAAKLAEDAKEWDGIRQKYWEWKRRQAVV